MYGRFCRYAAHLEDAQGEYEGAEQALKLGVLMHPTNASFLVKLGGVAEVIQQKIESPEPRAPNPTFETLKPKQR